MPNVDSIAGLVVGTAGSLGQVAMLVVLALVAWRAGLFRAQKEAAAAWEDAAAGRDAANTDLQERVAKLEKELGEARVAMALLERQHKGEMSELRATLEAEIKRLEERVDVYGCENAPGCKDRRRVLRLGGI